MTKALRRQPTQQRGAARVDQLLDACGELLDEMGYDALTTRAVAARAGSSIGSFYQFFGDKSQLVQAFGQRNLDRYVERITQRLESSPPARWTGMLNVVFDEYVTFRRIVPGFGVVDFDLVGEGDASQHLAEQLDELMVRLFSRSSTQEIRRALRVAIEAADALVRLSFRDDKDGNPALLDEARHLVQVYLSRYLDAD